MISKDLKSTTIDTRSAVIISKLTRSSKTEWRRDFASNVADSIPYQNSTIKSAVAEQGVFVF